MKKLNIPLLLLIMAIGVLSACKKLDVKPSQSLVVPTTLEDFQRMLDNTDFVFNANYCALGEVASDNYYVPDNLYQVVYAIQEKNAYIWDKDVFKGATIEGDWDSSFSTIFYCNVILDGLKSLHPDANRQQDFNNIKGQALFHRAYTYFMLTQEFCKSYTPSTANTDLGMPIRTTSDINNITQRSNLQATYDLIINDLTSSIALLNDNAPYKTRPTKAAAKGMLARVYLANEDYKNALLFANACLQTNSTLIDYNKLDPSSSFPLDKFNNEVVFHADLTNLDIFYYALVDSTLYKSYATNDLRKTIFFNDNGDKTFSFKGNYEGYSIPLFGGMATDELYLIKAECEARAGNSSTAIADLNKLLINRYSSSTFIPVTASSADDALLKILSERRKELILRGVRWSDLRRLNKDSRFAVTLSRTVEGKRYSLPPNDARYVFPIPDYIITLSGLTQNP